MIQGVPATAGDLAHVWMMTHPGKQDAGRDSGLRNTLAKDGAKDSALNFWFGGG
tara:strand:+ start:1251 stop:1412 length:162 start_codon:yes stop_codon:yes gene_type:complete